MQQEVCCSTLDGCQGKNHKGAKMRRNTKAVACTALERSECGAVEEESGLRGEGNSTFF